MLKIKFYVSEDPVVTFSSSKELIHSSAPINYATGCVMVFGSSVSQQRTVYLFVRIETTSKSNTDH